MLIQIYPAQTAEVIYKGKLSFIIAGSASLDFQSNYSILHVPFSERTIVHLATDEATRLKLQAGEYKNKRWENISEYSDKPTEWLFTNALHDSGRKLGVIPKDDNKYAVLTDTDYRSSLDSNVWKGDVTSTPLMLKRDMDLSCEFIESDVGWWEVYASLTKCRQLRYQGFMESPARNLGNEIIVYIVYVPVSSNNREFITGADDLNQIVMNAQSVPELFGLIIEAMKELRVVESQFNRLPSQFRALTKAGKKTSVIKVIDFIRKSVVESSGGKNVSRINLVISGVIAKMKTILEAKKVKGDGWVEGRELKAGSQHYAPMNAEASIEPEIATKGREVKTESGYLESVKTEAGSAVVQWAGGARPKAGTHYSYGAMPSTSQHVEGTIPTLPIYGSRSSSTAYRDRRTLQVRDEELLEIDQGIPKLNKETSWEAAARSDPEMKAEIKYWRSRDKPLWDAIYEMTEELEHNRHAIIGFILQLNGFEYYSVEWIYSYKFISNSTGRINPDGVYAMLIPYKRSFGVIALTGIINERVKDKSRVRDLLIRYKNEGFRYYR